MYQSFLNSQLEKFGEEYHNGDRDNTWDTIESFIREALEAQAEYFLQRMPEERDKENDCPDGCWCGWCIYSVPPYNEALNVCKSIVNEALTE